MMRRTKTYWLRLILITVLLIALAVIGLPLGLGGRTMWALIHPPCSDDRRTPDQPYQAVNMPSHAGGTIRAYFIPGTKDATVIVPAAYNGGRGSMLDEASLLAADGFNVLTYESPVCAGRSVISLGYKEVEDVGDALAYLRHNNDNIHVNLNNLAIHGFSSAGATSTMAAARYPEIKALLAEGGYHNADEMMGVNDSHNYFESLVLLGSELAYRLSTGESTATLDPLDALKHVPPRSIYLVYGTSEPSYPGAKAQLAAVRQQSPDAVIRLWEVPNATHGGYIRTVGVEEYKRHVLPFYNCALLHSCDAWVALWKSF